MDTVGGTSVRRKKNGKTQSKPKASTTTLMPLPTLHSTHHRPAPRTARAPPIPAQVAKGAYRRRRRRLRCLRRRQTRCGASSSSSSSSSSNNGRSGEAASGGGVGEWRLRDKCPQGRWGRGRWHDRCCREGDGLRRNGRENIFSGGRDACVAVW